MSLVRQFFLIIIGVLVISVLSNYWINLSSMRLFLERQMQTHVQDTATSLGISLSPAIAAADKASVDTQLNAVFDSGYYRKITVYDKADGVLSQRSQSGQVLDQQAPRWFVALVGLAQPSARSEVSNGWTRVGTVVVVSHTGLAYAQLWQGTLRNLLATLVLALASSLLIWLVMRRVTRPLKAVVAQAQALTKNRFERVQALPHTPELRVLVQAMNQMVDALEGHVSRLSEEAQRWHEQAFQDDLSALPNRRMLIQHLCELSDAEDDYCAVSLALVRVNGIEAANQESGFRGGDAIIVSVAELLVQHFEHLPGTLVARSGGPEFAVLARDQDAQLVERQLQRVIDALGDILPPLHGKLALAVGVISTRPGQTAECYLSAADTALSEAIKSGQNMVAQHLSEHEGRLGQSARLQLLEKALTERNFRLSRQRVCDTSGQDFAHEYYLQVAYADAWLSAASLLGSNTEPGLALSLDRLVLEQVIQQHDHSSLAMVNVNVQALLGDEHLSAWLHRFDAAERKSVAFEFSQLLAPRDPGKLVALRCLLSSLGVKLGVDHFGFHADSLQWLTVLQPDYVKLDAIILQQLLRDEAHTDFVSALLTVAHSFGIQVYAAGVETTADMQRLAALAFDGFQGFALERPQPVET